MRILDIAHLYGVRLKARVVLVQELFSVFGIAVGVALLFASQVASASLNGSIKELTGGIVGQSSYQLTARDTHGFDERLVGEAQSLAGVRGVAPVLEQHVGVIGPAGRRSVDLLGADPRMVHIAGSLLQHFSAHQLALQQAIVLPSPLAQAIGTGPLHVIKLQIGARIVPTLLVATLGSAEIGSLVESPVAVAPLSYAQKITAMRGRVTRIFVQVQPGREREVREGLLRLAAGRLNVQPADFESTLFSQASGPTNQSITLFSAICALVGFMFAYCSMLLTMHLRQSLIRELRRNGATRAETVKVLLFDALVLGGLAAVLGLAIGELLSVAVFHSNPGYLSFAFPVGSQRVVTWQSIALSAGAGLLAACVGVLSPLRELSSRVETPRRLVESSGAPRWRRLGALGAGVACLVLTTAILLAGIGSIAAAILGIVSLIVALLLFLPLLLDALVAGFDRLQRAIGGGATQLAAVELHAPQLRARALAIAATGAIAVFGAVAIEGARANLQHGLDRLFRGITATAALWVVPGGQDNLLATVPFKDSARAALQRLPGVQAVGLYRAGFLDYEDRRIWVTAPPPEAVDPVPPSQLVTGDPAAVTAKLRGGGWAVVSEGLAEQHHLRIGQRFTLPSPQPMTFRIAALSTNLGWPPGAVVINAADYARAWRSPDPSAYNIALAPGASAPPVRREVEQALGPASGLTVETAHQRESSQRTASRQGLGRLTQIAWLVLIAGVLATATSMGAMISQRRRRFARMKVQGYRTRMLWAALLWESALLLGCGCAIGAAFGLYSQLLQSHALAVVTGFPVIFSLEVPVALGGFAVVTAVAVAILAIPGYRAASVPPYP